MCALSKSATAALTLYPHSGNRGQILTNPLFSLENTLQATRWLRRSKVPEVLSEEVVGTGPSLPLITVASEHAISICRMLRYSLQRIPMLDNFSLVVKSEDVYPSVIVITRPMLLAMKHH